MLILSILLAACDLIIGCISPPPNIPSGIGPQGQLTGITLFLNSILKLIFIAAGLYGFLNIIIAGFDFMSAGGDAKMVARAWSRIWQTVVGLLIIVSSFLLAAIIGIILFKDPTAILQPSIQVK